MARKADVFQPPLMDSTKEAWLVYTDWLKEHDKPIAEIKRATRITVALGECAGLALVGYERLTETLIETVAFTLRRWSNRGVYSGRLCWWKPLTAMQHIWSTGFPFTEVCVTTRPAQFPSLPHYAQLAFYRKLLEVVFPRDVMVNGRRSLHDEYEGVFSPF